MLFRFDNPGNVFSRWVTRPGSQPSRVPADRRSGSQWSRVPVHGSLRSLTCLPASGRAYLPHTLFLLGCVYKVRQPFHCFPQLLLQGQHVILVFSRFQGHWLVICILFNIRDKVYLNKLRILLFLLSMFLCFYWYQWCFYWEITVH